MGREVRTLFNVNNFCCMIAGLISENSPLVVAEDTL